LDYLGNAVLRRNNTGLGPTSFDYDHIVPYSKGG
jgi:hypothetical protein